jgi:peptide chain release factor subunit 1
MFDPRLHVKILKVVEVSFGGEIGFNEAIDHFSDILSDVKFIQEKRLIRKYFQLLSQEDTESTESNEKQVFAVVG